MPSIEDAVELGSVGRVRIRRLPGDRSDGTETTVRRARRGVNGGDPEVTITSGAVHRRATHRVHLFNKAERTAELLV